MSQATRVNEACIANAPPHLALFPLIEHGVPGYSRFTVLVKKKRALYIAKEPQQFSQKIVFPEMSKILGKFGKEPCKSAKEPLQFAALFSQCVAVCCSVLQCVAVCCRVLQTATHCNKHTATHCNKEPLQFSAFFPGDFKILARPPVGVLENVGKRALCTAKEPKQVFFVFLNPKP